MLSRGALLPLVSNLPSIILICLSILSLAIGAAPDEARGCGKGGNGQDGGRS